MREGVSIRAFFRPWVTADEVAQAVLLLKQNEAITGETIHVDCGARLV